MSEFVKVACNDVNFSPYTQHEEIIKTKDLIKIVKLEGNEGTGIRFEWYCENRKSYMKWDYETPNRFIRDRIFDNYEKLLTGTYIDTEVDLKELRKTFKGDEE